MLKLSSWVALMSSLAEPFLNEQIDLYGTQSAAAESRFVNGGAADFGDIEDAIALGLATFASLRRHSEAWADAIDAGKASFCWDVSRQFSDQYRNWKEQTATLLKAINRCETTRSDLAGERELRDAFKDVSLMGLNADEMRAAYESLQAGEGIPHSEAMDELRRRVAARRT